jgi:peptidyl-tRNA hydrolase, PTH1 family
VKIIVGLGNPGPQYRNTRHNAGFMALDRLAGRIGAAFDRSKFDSEIAQAQLGTHRLLLVKPQTFMNLSGVAVAKAARNKIDGLEDLLIVVDEVHLPLGRLRFRPDGSAGGHNGLKSIIEHVGSDAFPRLRMGVGKSGAARELADHVLSGFTPEERPVVDRMVERAADGIETFIEHGIERAMDRFNRADPNETE